MRYDVVADVPADPGQLRGEFPPDDDGSASLSYAMSSLLSDGVVAGVRLRVEHAAYAVEAALISDERIICRPCA